MYTLYKLVFYSVTCVVFNTHKLLYNTTTQRRNYSQYLYILALSVEIGVKLCRFSGDGDFCCFSYFVYDGSLVDVFAITELTCSTYTQYFCVKVHTYVHTDNTTWTMFTLRLCSNYLSVSLIIF